MEEGVQAEYLRFGKIVSADTTPQTTFEKHARKWLEGLDAVAKVAIYCIRKCHR